MQRAHLADDIERLRHGEEQTDCDDPRVIDLSQGREHYEERVVGHA
jgi:hypothetical protein